MNVEMIKKTQLGGGTAVITAKRTDDPFRIRQYAVFTVKASTKYVQGLRGFVSAVAAALHHEELVRGLARHQPHQRGET